MGHPLPQVLQRGSEKARRVVSLRLHRHKNKLCHSEAPQAQRNLLSLAAPQTPPLAQSRDNRTLSGASLTSDFIKRSARAAGFDLAGISSVHEFPELARFPEWIAAGHAGEMKYLESRDQAGNLRRASLKSAFPWARSVIVCAVNYNTAHPYSTNISKPGHGWISRYAWSREDYHESVLRRLREVEAKLKNSCGSDPIETRAYVDTGPLVERVYAKYAGVGWLGKNTCMINQKIGSCIYLFVIVISL